MSVSYSLVKYVPKFGKNAGKGKFYARATGEREDFAQEVL